MKVVITKVAERDLAELDIFTQKRIVTELLKLDVSLIGADIK